MRKPPVVATILNYGLGNQMFQYAAGRRLALAIGGELLLMPAFEEKPGTHAVYGLKRFNIAGREVPVDMPPWEVDRSLKARIKAMIPEWLRAPGSMMWMREDNIFNFIEASKAGELQETRTLIFMPQMLRRRRGTKLFGHWHNEVYFRDVADVIRNDFTLTGQMDAMSLDCLARIKSRPSAFLHVRRGDYLEPMHQIRFGTCTADYYHQAVAYLKRQYGDDLAMYVFGNDPEWIKENQIGGADAVFVGWNHAAPEHDLMLMRACQHAVIANSSFSWWGAWLGEWPGQSVIAPKTWYNAVPEYCDIIPERWIRM